MGAITDVLVVGGGLMGCSTAYHLARQGVKRHAGGAPFAAGTGNDRPFRGHHSGALRRP